MNRPFIIGIAGESGVGKTSIAELVSVFYGVENVLILSTDDLHKWERGNEAWNTITHLNPEANNLELGDIHLEYLSKNKPIYRSVYNHTTGNFNPPIKIEPRKIIIIEGLHAFYTDTSKNLIDLKIFIDTNEELRKHWKIIRDTEERGYKYNVVLDAINKRKKDADKIKHVQIELSDVVIELKPNKKIECLGDKNEKFNLDLIIKKNNSNFNLIDYIKKYNDELNNFISLSENFGSKLYLCQDGGGNISVKICDKHMIIKSSGFNMKDVKKNISFSLINYKEFINANESNISSILNNSTTLKKYKRPSMEAGFHALLGKYVVHLHPIYLTTLLCLKNSKNIINDLFSTLNYKYIEYKNPGYDLFNEIRSQEKNSIYFLENHGIIISSDDIEYINYLINFINEECKNFIKGKSDFEEFNLYFSECDNDLFPFPDSVVFSNSVKLETKAAHNYIIKFGEMIGEIRYLSSDNINALKDMESEKYRKSI